MNLRDLDAGIGAVPTEQEVIQRATALVPWLRERAVSLELAGQVSTENIQQLRDAGFFKILQPRVFGGYEMSPLTFYRVLQEVASGCPSTGWVLMVLGVHNWEMALLDPRCAQDVWSDDVDVLISSSYGQWGQCEAVEGGYRLNGTWRFSSGCDHGQWAFLGGLIARGEGEMPDHRVFLVPRTDYQIAGESWKVFGLQGTGSKSLVLKDVFVPAYRTHSLVEHFFEQGSDVGLRHHDSPYYRVPFGVAFGNAVASVVVGMAKGMLEVYCAQMQVRRVNETQAAISENPMVQRRVNLADTKVRSARNLIRDVVEGSVEYLAAGQAIPLEKRAQYVADAASAAEFASEASVLLLRGSGGKGIMLDNLLQFYFRSIQAGCNHICMDLDKLGVNAGGTLLGQPNQVIVS